jgi:NDP-sugar pyrophosphorylase family protein
VEKELLGTGGAIKKALSLTGTRDVLVLNGDSYAELDLAAFYDFHKSRKSLFTLALRQVPDAGRYGRVETGARGLVTRFEEKAPGGGPGLVNAGVYLAARGVFDGVAEGKKISLEKEILPGLAGRGAYGRVVTGRFIDIGLPETYKAAGKYLKGK